MENIKPKRKKQGEVSGKKTTRLWGTVLCWRLHCVGPRWPTKVWWVDIGYLAGMRTSWRTNALTVRVAFSPIYIRGLRQVLWYPGSMSIKQSGPKKSQYMYKRNCSVKILKEKFRNWKICRYVKMLINRMSI